MTTPRYLTPRTSPYTYGRKIAAVSALIGRPFMPWQQLAANLIGEHDGAGNLLHPLVVVTVPRQSGKTALIGAVMLHRMMMRKQARVWYTAQSGLKARDQMKELMEFIELSKAAKLFTTRRGNDLTSIEIPQWRSRIVAHPPTADSLHSNQSDLNVIDEGWYLNPELGSALMGAIVPTQATRPNAQTIIVSTAGTARSTWFHGYVDRGRAGEIPLVDYGVSDDVTDPTDFEAIAAAHPAIGLTQKFSILPAAYATMNSPGEFMRAYGNKQTATHERLIPLELVELATVTTDLPPGRPVFGAAVSFERDDAVIVACTTDAAGVPVCEVIEQWPHTEGVPERLAQLADRHDAHVVIAQDGPSAPVADAAERLGAAVTRVGAAELSAATGDMLDRLRRPAIDPTLGPGVFLRAHPAFTAALDGVTLRTSGDRIAWSRRGSAASVAALEAATLAVLAALTRPKPPVAPMIWS